MYHWYANDYLVPKAMFSWSAWLLVINGAVNICTFPVNMKTAHHIHENQNVLAIWYSIVDLNFPVQDNQPKHSYLKGLVSTVIYKNHLKPIFYRKSIGITQTCATQLLNITMKKVSSEVWCWLLFMSTHKNREQKICLVYVRYRYIEGQWV